MDRIRNSKLSVSLILQIQQILPAMIHSTTNPSIFPHRMLHPRQFVQFRADLFWTPSLLGQAHVLDDAGTLGHEFGLEPCDSGGDLLVDFAADARGAEEEGVEEETDPEVDIADCAEDTMAAEGVERSLEDAEEEECEDDVPDSMSPD